MYPPTGIFEIEKVGEVIVLSPWRDLRELEYSTIEAELCRLANEPSVTRVVVDLGRTDYFGSTALGMLTVLCGHVEGRGGRIAFCNLSEHEREILALTGLTEVWPVYASRREALEAVAAPGFSPIAMA
jgi:anti-anti-sigma factor